MIGKNSTNLRPRMCLHINRLAGFVVCLVAFVVSPSIRADQTISLDVGWNLIAVQVEPTDPSPEAVFGPVAGLISAWTYEATGEQWLAYRSSAFDEAAAEKNALSAVSFSALEMGRAYWILMNTAGSITISGTKPPLAPAVKLKQGWNLIGIPVAGPQGQTLPAEPIPMIAVLALQGLDYDVLLKWQRGPSLPPGADAEALGYNKNRFGTTQEGTINEDQFRLFDPNQGYWIRVTEPRDIKPELLATVRGDVDTPPLGNFPNGPEDVVISASATPIGSSEQDRIVFFEDEDVQRLSFSNEGGGVMLWNASWEQSDPSLGQWLSLSYEQGADGKAVSLAGVTTTESETLYLRLDRANLSRSTYTGLLKLKTSAGDRDFAVTAHIGGLKGEWSGFAEIRSVNGKRNKVPDIDLNLSFFEDRATAGLLRGAIDSSQSVLWPMDVQLVGYITSNDGNAFQLGGSFVLPPGDQNNEPYDQWDPSATGNDVDWNDDGFNPSDRINPFPFPVYRSVNMEGRLTSANPINGQGYVIEGVYQEVIHGMMRDPIKLEGSFTLNRNSPVPFDTLRQTVRARAGSVTSPVATGPTPGRRIISNGASTPLIPAVPIGANLIVQDLGVSFSIKNALGGNLPSANITVELEAPSGQKMVLHDGSAIDPTLLRNASYPDQLTPLGTSPRWETFVSSIGATRGDWRINFVNNSGTSIDFSNLRIMVVGQPVIDVYGKVLDSGGLPIQGADISISGLPFSEVSPGATDSSGKFKLSRIPAMPVNMGAFLPGYTGGGSILQSQLIPEFSGTVVNSAESRLSARFAGKPLPAVPVSELGISGFKSLGSSDTERFEIRLEQESGPVEISALPDFGVAQLEVRFHAVRGAAGGAFQWEFGDGTSASGQTVSHLYEKAGVFTVALTHQGTVLTKEIVVMPSPGNTPLHPSDIVANQHTQASNYQYFFFQPRLTGGGSLPANLQVPDTSGPEAVPVDLVMIQHAYAASADIDLAPKVASAGEAFGSDNFTTGSVNYWASTLNNQPLPGNGQSGLFEENSTFSSSPVNDPGWVYEDHNYVLWSAKWFDDKNDDKRLNPGEDDIGGLTGYKYDSSGDNDDRFETPRPTGVPGEPFTYYRMTCNIGARIVGVGISGASVQSTEVDPVKAPKLETGPLNGGTCGNLTFRLSVNPFVGF